jgi:hypothetical protein
VNPQFFLVLLFLEECLDFKNQIKFKGDEAKEFLKERNGGFKLLQEYLEDSAMMLENLSIIQVNLLNDPYREMEWFFSTVVGQESTTTIPHLSLYIPYLSIDEKLIFDWVKYCFC